jgi:hypothetical protein
MMKSMRMIVMLSMLFLSTAGAAFAQQDDDHAAHHPETAATDGSAQAGGMMQDGMMQGGMMGMMGGMDAGMMNHPVRRTAYIVRMLPSMQETLGLTEAQQDRLEAMKENFNNRHEAMMNEAGESAAAMQSVTFESSPAEVRNMLREAATARAEMQALAFETAAQMRDVLTEEQRETLAGMNPMQMRSQMMSGMTMMDMMNARQSMMDSCPMMQGGMMNGMMQGNGMNASPRP